MPKYEHLRYHQHHGNTIVRLVADRLHEGDGQQQAFVAELDDALLRAEADDRVRVVIIGGPVFSSDHAVNSGTAWQDATPHAYAASSGTARDDGSRPRLEWRPLFDGARRWRSIRKILIAQAEGTVRAPGLMLMWCCDLIVGADDVVFEDVVGTSIGLCGLGYFAHPWEFGARKTLELMLTGDAIGIRDAYSMGIVSKVFPRRELDDRTLEFAERIAQTPPMTALLMKESIQQTLNHQGFGAALDACRSIGLIGRSGGVADGQHDTYSSGARDSSQGVGNLVERRSPFGVNPRVGERGTITQRRILEAAMGVFAEVGYHDTRVELITEAAGCSRPTFYQYFSSKEDVFWYLAGQLGNSMVSMGERLGTITDDEHGVLLLRTWLRDFTDLHDHYAPVFSAFQEAIRDAGAGARGWASINERLGQSLRRAFTTQVTPASMTSVIMTLITRCTFHWHQQAADVSRERFAAGMAHVIHRLAFGPHEGVNVMTDGAAPTTGPEASIPAAAASREVPIETRQPPSRGKGVKTRRRLIDAGAAVLLTRGYHDARISDVVTKAGLSHGSFYTYFDSKDHLFCSLAEQAVTEMDTLMNDFPTSLELDPLRTWLTAWFDTYRRHGGIFSTLHEVEFDDPRLKALSRELPTRVFRRLVSITSECSVGDPVLDAVAILTILERLPYTVFALRQSDEERAIAAGLPAIRRALGLPDADERIPAASTPLEGDPLNLTVASD